MPDSRLSTEDKPVNWLDRLGDRRLSYFGIDSWDKDRVCRWIIQSTDNLESQMC